MLQKFDTCFSVFFHIWQEEAFGRRAGMYLLTSLSAIVGPHGLPLRLLESYQRGLLHGQGATLKHKLRWWIYPTGALVYAADQPGLLIIAGMFLI